MEGIVAVHPAQENENVPMFTCNTCGLRFPTADLQRVHMKTDWHRYNLKRRVANLPAISSELFADKMMQQQHVKQLAEERTGRGSSARSSGNRQVTKKDKKREEKLKKRSHRGHPTSHDDEGVRAHSPEGSVASSTFSLGEPVGSAYAPSVTTEGDDLDDFDDYDEVSDGEEALLSQDGQGSESVNEGDITEVNTEVNSKTNSLHGDEDDIDLEEQEIRKRIARAIKIPPNVCLVDGKQFDSVEENVQYMVKAYGLFIPEQEYLTDLEGLIAYLGEKVGLGNMCLYCNFQGKSVHSVRSHMVDKGHVKLPYDSLDEKLEISDFYDFTSSYGKAKTRRPKDEDKDIEDEEWEDVSGEEDSGDEDSGNEEFDEQNLETDGYELTIAPGVRAGHRSLQRYYRQNLRPALPATEGQGTVLAVDRRAATGGALVIKDPAQLKAQKQTWKEEKKQKNILYRRDKFINNQPHYRDELLQ
jgi:pre-60S factor REI1